MAFSADSIEEVIFYVELEKFKMSISSIISAIGNNSSIYPLLVRDCGIENPAKIIMTYQQNKEDKYIAKNAVREKIIDEYGTSAIWLGGIPAVEWCANKIIKMKGFNPNVNIKLFNEDEIQGIDKNIIKFRDLAPEAVDDLIKIKNNKKVYEKLLSIKFVAAIAIPVAVMGFILPKMNFALTRKKMQESKNKDDLQIKTRNPVFMGNFASAVANMTTVQKMAMTDGGLTVGRVGTSRNKNEAFDNAFRMGGMLYLNFVAPKQIAKGLDKLSNKMFGLDVELDPLIINDKEFVKQIKENKLLLPKSNSAKDLIEFVDNNPQSLFVKFADKFGKIKMLTDKIRDPRVYVDIEELINFKKAIENFRDKGLANGQLEQFARKAKFVKCANILANVGISSALLAYVLPKVQFKVRKLVTGSDFEPGVYGELQKNAK